ncbi:MAG: hypothetical protein ABII18_06240 [bacterium]|nr:hypothetical protein [bacterium]
MDLSFLIPSKSRRCILSFFSNEPTAQVYVHELAKELSMPAQLIYRELINLESWGFLFSFKRGNQRVFQINNKFPLKSAVISLFQKQIYPEVEIEQVFQWKTLKQKYNKIPHPPLKENVRKQIKPRAFDEEKAMRKKGLL